MEQKEDFDTLLDDIDRFSKGNGLDELTELVILAVDALAADRESELMKHLFKANDMPPLGEKSH